MPIADRDTATASSGANANANSAALDDMTNTLRESSEDGMVADAVRTSQSMTKQWVRLRQQQAEGRKIILAKENNIATLQSQLQRQQEQTGAFRGSAALLCDFE